jgi:tetratricopeptide (TPR) repeat protein
MNGDLDIKAERQMLVRYMQMRPLVVRAASCFVVVFLLLGLGQARAAEAPSEEAAMKHFARALELVDQSDFQGALQQFKDAYAAKPHFAVWYNIAQAHISLGQPLEAIEALLRCLREGQDQIPPEKRLQVEEQIKSLEAFLGELEVTTEPSGALLTVDGREIGRTPLSEPIRLVAGMHKIAASLDGRPTVERTVSMQRERRYQLYLQLPSPPPQAPKAGTADAILRSSEVERIEPTPVRSRLRVALPYVVASAGIILAGATVPAYLWERDAYHKWQNAQPALQKANQGSPAYADAAKENNRLADSVTTAKYTLWGLAIASGALIVGGGCLYYFDRPSTASSATLTVAFGTGASFTANWGGSW